MYLIRRSRFNLSMASSVLTFRCVVWMQNLDPNPRVVDSPFGGSGVPGGQRLWKLDVVGLLKYIGGGVFERACWIWAHGAFSGLEWKPKVREQNRFVFWTILFASRVVIKLICCWKVLFTLWCSFCCIRWAIRRDIRFVCLGLGCRWEKFDVLGFICVGEESSGSVEVEVSILGESSVEFSCFWCFRRFLVGI